MSYKPYPYRVFHYDDISQDLTWGRIYGNKCGIERLHKFLIPMIQINGERIREIDIKSCIPQLFVLHHCSRVDNKQDFYSYDSLEGHGLDREDVKLLTQCLINNEDVTSSMKSFKFGNRGRFDTMKLTEFKKIVKSMLDERPYFKRLFNVANTGKRQIRLESNFMIDLIDELLDKGIVFVYHFDGLIVPESMTDKVVETIQKLSMKKWNKELRVEVS